MLNNNTKIDELRKEADAKILDAINGIEANGEIPKEIRAELNGCLTAYFSGAPSETITQNLLNKVKNMYDAPDIK